MMLPISDEAALLLRIADRLEQWADASLEGGWSTHQLVAQRRLAIELRNAVMTRRYSEVLP